MIYESLQILFMKSFILLPVFFIVPILHAQLEIADFKVDHDIELELVGAAHNGTPVRLDGQSNGEFIAWTPYATALSREIGLLEFFETQGAVTLEEGILSGKLTLKLPPPGPEHRRGDFISQTFVIQGQAENGVIGGPWTRGTEKGILHGFTDHSLLVEYFGSGTVALDCAYPFPGREGGIGYQGLQARLGSAFTIKDGSITNICGEINSSSQFMLCGNPDMINDMVDLLGTYGLERNRRSKPGNITLEKYW